METRTLQFHLYLDRSGALKVRKNKYNLEDGEIRIGLKVSVPKEFFKPRSIEIEQSVDLHMEELPKLDVEITPNADFRRE